MERRTNIIAFKLNDKELAQLNRLIEEGYFSSKAKALRTAIEILVFLLEETKKGKRVIVEANREDVIQIGNLTCSVQDR